MTTFPSTGRRRELGAELRHTRVDKGYNGNDMAAKLNWTATTLSRAETGRRPLTALDITLYLGLCGISGDRLQELLNLAAESDDFRIKPHPDQIPDELRTLMFHESTAQAIDIVEPVLIPGITQTPEYARAVFEAWGKFDEAGIDMRVDLRMDRKEVLTRYNPALCMVFVHENALRAMVGSPKIMSEQMLQLLFADSRPQCSVRVIPASAGSRGLTNGPFHIFHYADDPPVAYVEHEITSDFLENQEVVRAYQDVLKRVATVALGEAESRSLIASLASSYDQQGVTRREDHDAGVAKE